MIGLELNHTMTHLPKFGLFQKSIMKANLKDILTVTITDAKKQVKDLSNSQVANLITKLNKLREIVSNESDARYEQEIIDDMEQQIEDSIEHEFGESAEEE